MSENDLKAMGLTKQSDGTYSKAKPIKGNAEKVIKFYEETGCLPINANTSSIEFKLIIPIEPSPTPRPRLGKYGAYNLSSYTNYKKAVTTSIRIAKVPENKWIEVECIFYYSYPKKTAKKNRIEGTKKLTNPDSDNLGKAILDALQDAGTIKDDNAIADMIFRKRYTTRDPRTEVTLRG